MMRFDALVVGAGIAGLSAAIRLARKGAHVCLVSKSANPLECNSLYAQGGIVARGEEDSPDLLKHDILEAGDGINSVEAVEKLSCEGPDLVMDFLADELKVPFIRDEKGYLLTREAAHSVRRILHVHDYTGRSIMEHLFKAAEAEERISRLSNYTAIDIITSTHHSMDYQVRYKPSRALGMYLLNNENGEVIPVFASAVLLATGGLGDIFQHTSNPKGVVGDGIAMAYRANVEIINAEFVQFHPTTLFHRDSDRFLISESVRGEGARLLNREGEYFMSRYSPRLKDLAPRDEVARGIYRQIEKDKAGYVYLDARGIKDHDLTERFPSIFAACAAVNIDIRKDLIPVVPAAHYSCGGIKVDPGGKTSLDGLYAVGETACTGVHGANRLASVSLLEGLYYGVHVAETILSQPHDLSDRLIRSIPPWVSPLGETSFDPVLIRSDLNQIQSTMWNYVGIIRTKKRLSRAFADLNYLNHRIERFYRSALLRRDVVELRNAIISALVVTRSALNNGQSIGCHYLQG
ncbi:L-aspartate oxidase [Marispirochaeta sp.]|uniref:L-aspartate oxidase n=1 Tax=Marispirochaeta sp. TaxID=2038653 RepID=UPI0029C8FEB0|nr:L-aspartate oxidase [Marispirochaeta sp.]